MSVNVETPIAITTANGATTVFPHSFTVLAASDLKVIGVLAGVKTTFVLGVDFTVSGVGADAGAVTFTTPPANGMVITRYRDSEIKRATDYQDNGDLLADTVNADFDRLWLALQELLFGGKSSSPSSLRAPAGETLTELSTAATRANKTLGFDASGNPTVLTPVAGSAASVLALLADGANIANGAALVSDAKTFTSAQTRTQAAINDDTATIRDFLPAGFVTTNDATTYVQAALNSGASVVDFLGIALKHDAVTIPAGVWAKNVNSTKFTNAAGNVFLVNTGCMLTGKIIGTGITSAVQRGIYPAAAAVCDVALNVDVSNLPYGVHAAPIGAAGSANDAKRWTGYVYAHDIVGTTGASEGYGVLLESAEDCFLTVRAKNIKRHAVYLSAGARRNTIDATVDGCGNYAVQLNAISASQPACIHNIISVRAVNLTTDTPTQGGALAIVSACHYNTCMVFCTGSATTYEAVRVEGGSAGVQGDHPKGNRIVDGAIDGQFTGGDVIRMLNADGTHVRGNTIDAYATASVIATRRTGTNLSLHGGFIEGNTINAQGQAIKGIYDEINTVPSVIGLNDIRNNGAALRVDDQTGGKRTGYSRRAVFSGTTASIPTVNSGDTTATLSDNIQTSGRRVGVAITGSSGTFFNAPIHVVGVNGAPSETQTTFRVYNGAGSAQTFTYEGWVEGD